MSTITPARTSWRGALTTRGFAVHYLQMLAAMTVGMLVLGPLSMLVPQAGVEVHALLMATWMTAGMAVWMRWRRHSWASTAEMGLAMYVAFAVLFPPYWLGLLPPGALMLVGHVLMLPAMAIVMLRHREQYLAHCPSSALTEKPRAPREA
jgi:hypothetical protein